MAESLKKHWDSTQEANNRLAERNARLIAFYKAGGGSVPDFMRADFGSEIPNGLDIKPWPDHRISTHTIFESENYKTSIWYERIRNLKWGGGLRGEIKKESIQIPYFSMLQISTD